MPISAVQQSDAVLHTYTRFFSSHPPTRSVPRDWTRFPVLHSRTPLPILSRWNSLHTHLKLPIHPTPCPHPPPLVTPSLLSMSVLHSPLGSTLGSGGPNRTPTLFSGLLPSPAASYLSREWEGSFSLPSLSICPAFILLPLYLPFIPLYGICLPFPEAKHEEGLQEEKGDDQQGEIQSQGFPKHYCFLYSSWNFFINHRSRLHGAHTPQTYVWIPAPGTFECDLSWKRVIADVIK